MRGARTGPFPLSYRFGRRPTRLLDPHSLRLRLAVISAAIAAVAMVLLGGAFLVLLGNRLSASSRALLRERVDASVDQVTVDPHGTVTRTGSGDDDTWVLQGSTVVERGPGDATVQAAVGHLAGTGHRTQVLRDGDLLLMAAPLRVPVPAGSGPGPQVGTVVVAMSLQGDGRTEDLVQTAVVVLGGLVVLGTFAATRVMVGRALRPVATMTRQAADWSSTDVLHRFGAGDRPTELEELAGTLDGLLDRLAAVLRHEQRLTAELSHELRTPLARIVAEVDLLRARPRSAGELETGLAAVAGRAERMARIVDTLVTAARVGPEAPPGRCDVVAVVRAVVADYADDRLVAGISRGETSTAGIDGDVLERVLAPLVDNALRYAATSVRLTIGPGPTVRVGDDGPGLAPELLEEVFEPGRRGVPADGHPGAGLGLALSRRLARTAGGDVRLVMTSRGLDAVVDLPSA
jgi:two-component system heavy metal sensor histidine kinase CusS